MKKFIITFCLILGALVFLYFGLYSKKDSRTIVRFASWGSESEISILKPVLAEFEKGNSDIKIDFMHIPQNYFQKIHMLFASNTAPDVIFINNQYLPVYANANVLEDLSPYKNEFELDKFYSKSLKSMTYNKKLYAIPRDISNLVIFYNKDIFNKYKVPYPQKNWTYKEFLETAQKLTHLPKIFGISFEEEPLFYLPYLMSEGTGFEQNKLPDKKYQNALKFYADLRNKYHVAPQKHESASTTMAQMFLQGRLGMHLSGRWLVPKYREEANFDWDIISFPRGTKGSIVPLDSSGWAIAKTSKHKKEAIELIKYLSSKNSIKKFTQSGLIVPARKDAANSNAFLDNKKPQNSKIFLEVIESSEPTPVSVDYRQVLDKLKKQNEKLFN